MRKVIVLIMVILLPAYSYAAYKIYLKNGSVISGASSYHQRGNDIDIYFSTGSMTIRTGDVLKIEGQEEPSGETPSGEDAGPSGQKEQTRETAAPSPTPQPQDDRTAKTGALKAEIESLDMEIRAVEDKEAELVSSINDKTNSRPTYNIIQYKQLQKELEPLKQELQNVQQRKQELIKKRSALVTEFKSLE